MGTAKAIEMPRADAPIESVTVSAYRIPTDSPESDGTLEWNATTLVLVEITGGNDTGIGFSYADASSAMLIRDVLAPCILGRDAMSVAGCFRAMTHVVRNLGRPGIASMAISAVDSALWDLKAKILQLPLFRLLGAVRDRVPVYASGGFTSYDDARLAAQLGGWAEAGIGRVKMKVGREPKRDPARVAAARAAIGAGTELFVDANGAFGRKQALAMAETFAAQGVSWFEEPVTSDDIDGLRLLRDCAPAGMAVAAGEYSYGLADFRRLLAAGAVDVLQADATRCSGITGFMQAAALCEAFNLPLSAHCAPSLHVHACCAAEPVRHLEFFHDHVRIERMLFDGAMQPGEGMLRADPSRTGLGLDFRHKDAREYAL